MPLAGDNADSSIENALHLKVRSSRVHFRTNDISILPRFYSYAPDFLAYNASTPYSSAGRGVRFSPDVPRSGKCRPSAPGCPLGDSYLNNVSLVGTVDHTLQRSVSFP